MKREQTNKVIRRKVICTQCGGDGMTDVITDSPFYDGPAREVCSQCGGAGRMKLTITVSYEKMAAFSNLGASLSHVCNMLDIDEETIVKKTRKREIVERRQLAAWWLRKKNPDSAMEDIGKMLRIDRATAHHACKTVNNLIATNSEFRKRYHVVINS